MAGGCREVHPRHAAIERTVVTTATTAAEDVDVQDVGSPSARDHVDAVDGDVHGSGEGVVSEHGRGRAFVVSGGCCGCMHTKQRTV